MDSSRERSTVKTIFCAQSLIHILSYTKGWPAMELRYGELNHIVMWRSLEKGEHIRLVLDEDQAVVMDYLIKRISLVSTITISSPGYKVYQLIGLFLGNLGSVWKLWFKYRNLAQVDDLILLYKELTIERITGETECVFLMK